MRRVLIVEDNEDIRSIYAMYLRFRGYEVLEAENGYEGVQLARSGHPDIVVMDLEMPILDGLEATAVLKSDTTTASIPVVLVTAYSLLDERVGDGEGFEARLSKPVDPPRLVSELERLLGRADPAVRVPG